MIFVVSNIFSIVSLFLSCPRVFVISVYSSWLFLFYVETYAKSSSLIGFFFV